MTDEEAKRAINEMPDEELLTQYTSACTARTLGSTYIRAKYQNHMDEMRKEILGRMEH